MVNDKLKEALQEIADKIQEIVHDRMRQAPLSKHGESLVGSKLWDSVQTTTNGIDTVAFQIADYWMYTNSGRFDGVGGFGDPRNGLLIDGITRMVGEKNLKFEGMTQTQTIWVITKSIWKNGIKARPFTKYKFVPKEQVDNIDYILDFLDDYWENDWMPQIINAITSELDNYFNNGNNTKQ